MADEVLTQRDGAVLIITINRPEAKNAVNAAVAHAMAAALDELEDDKSLVAGIITGAAGTFCSGMDLKAFVKGEIPRVEGRGFAGITEKPPAKPVISAVEGYALAGGCEIVLSTDLVVAAEDAKFGLPETKRALVAGAGGLFRLPTRIPRNIAMEYALTGEFFTAAQAHGWGLVNRVTPKGGALEESLALAKAIAANGPVAVRETKKIIAESPGWPADEIWSRQAQIMEVIVASKDAREGATAFAERRAPVWSGE